MMPHPTHRIWRRIGVLIALPPFLYGNWLAMLVAHEFGHVLAAVTTGGRVRQIVIPWFGFSRTDVANPTLAAVIIWAGPLVGCFVPLLAMWLCPRRWRLRAACGFFAGFCCIANGAYLSMGWAVAAGDASDLARLGAPRWLLMSGGAALIACGLMIWHRLGFGARTFTAAWAAD